MVIAVACSLCTAIPSFAEYIRATNEETPILVSIESEMKMGRSLARAAEKKHGLLENTVLQKRISDIGQKIASICDRQDIRYNFKILKGEKLKPHERINAFALPGGYVYLFEDMISLMETDGEIAAIIAHEVGHIAAKHSVKRLQGSLGAMAFQLLAAGASRNAATRSRANQALGLLLMSYSREDEATADRLSVKYLRDAGYDPKAAISAIAKMSDVYQKMPIRKYTSYRSHPLISERMSTIKQEVHGRIDFVDFINTPTILGEQ